MKLIKIFILTLIPLFCDAQSLAVNQPEGASFFKEKDMHSEQVGMIYLGEKPTILETYKSNNPRWKWYKIKVNDKMGFIPSVYLSPFIMKIENARDSIYTVFSKDNKIERKELYREGYEWGDAIAFPKISEDNIIGILNYLEPDCPDLSKSAIECYLHSKKCSKRLENCWVDFDFSHAKKSIITLNYDGGVTTIKIITQPTETVVEFHYSAD